MARPSKYTDELGAQICVRLAEGESLRQICADDDMPNKSTVLRWLFDGDKEGFCDQYARAREIQAENWADEILEVADDGRNDWIERERNGETSLEYNGDHVQRSRLRVDTRKWLMTKLRPKKYGERQEIDHRSSDGSMTPNCIQLVGPDGNSPDTDSA